MIIEGDIGINPIETQNKKLKKKEMKMKKTEDNLDLHIRP